uniref:Endoglucanase n=1 Tax=Xylophaga rikuzenica TaxID=2028187 RepID=A0A455XGC3_9BIVA|nr:GH9 cellulase [Xylophaga rikuzenica]
MIVTLLFLATAALINAESSTRYDYKEALRLSILFYDAQRSGRLPADNPIPWRGDSAVDDGDAGHDLSGGWYDAGDHVKFGLPMAWASWVLNYGLVAFPDAYEATGQTAMACDSVRWPLEYFLKCWIPSENKFYAQVGDGNSDHSFWGSPENMRMSRPASAVTTSCPGSDVAGKTVSALASGYLVFKDTCGDASFAADLLSAAESLYAFAKNNKGLYDDCMAAGDFYSSSSYQDELAAAAAWMAKATGESSYLSDARSFYPNGTAWGFNWNDDNVGAAVVLYDVTGEDFFKNDVVNFVSSYSSGRVQKTPCGLSYRDKWGPNRHAANAAFIATLAASLGLNANEANEYAQSQINYILGDNPLGISYEIGFGNYFPKKPHHRGSSCRMSDNSCSINDSGDNPNQLDGGMVGGPGDADDYSDDRDDYVHNEVAVDYNAGFQSALAGLIHFAITDSLPAAPAPGC